MSIKNNLRENRRLLKNLLSEALVASKADKNPDFDPKTQSTPWTGIGAKYEQLIKKLGGRPYALPGGTHAYEIKLGNDIIKMYQDGTAYSVNNANEMLYIVNPEFSKNGITITNIKDRKKIEGAIENNNGIPTWKAEAPEKISKRDEESWIDYVQYALTVVGFIPGFGDIADIINAMISFYRYEESGREDTMFLIDAFLSLIGAIPVVGSIVAGSLKVLFKSIGGLKDAVVTAWKGRKSADEVWSALYHEGQLDPKTLNLLVEGMGWVASAVKSFSRKAEWMLPPDALKSLDEFAEYMKSNRNSAEQIFKSSSKRAADAVQGAGKGRGKGILKQRDLEKGWGLLGWKKIKNSLKNTFSRTLSTKELQKLKAAMASKFAKKAENPSVLTALLKTDPSGIASVTIGGRRFTRSGDIESALAALKRSNPDEYAKIKTKIIDRAKSVENPLYINFITSEVNAMKTFISQPGTFIGSAFSRWQNMVPVAWNELQDLGEDALMSVGLETKDDVNGLFWPMLKSLILGVTPEEQEEKLAKKSAEFVSAASSKLPPTLQALGKTALNIVAPGAVSTPYNPNVEFEIVPDEDPRLIKQTEKDIKKAKSKSRWT
jgi:hypothetical protein